MIISNTYTHVGWFGPCPVYLGDLTSECPSVTPRWPWATVIFALVIGFCEVADWLLTRVRGTGLEIGFLVTGELEEQLVIWHEVDDGPTDGSNPASRR